ETELEKYTKSVYSSLPDAIAQVFSRRGEIEEIAKKHYKAENAFFIGRGADGYVTDEASLKLKEISYIHSESYPAGELKHGTISLVSDGVPVIAVATRPSLYEKITSNIREVSSRGGDVILICGADFGIPQNVSEAFALPACDEFVSPIAAATAAQLFAYETAKYRGCDIDKPRNLAKSVTVE
ncbi:MAG: SIS domain-containing protein, partial [Clostridiales bacterium]|nr:SIS domain-containing protein [Clostridiales bacterium]